MTDQTNQPEHKLWMERTRRAGHALRNGAESLRRDVLAVVPENAQPEVAAALDSGLERLRLQVAEALGGDKADD